jgi:hypothetical protein
LLVRDQCSLGDLHLILRLFGLDADVDQLVVDQDTIRVRNCAAHQYRWRDRRIRR